MFRRFDMIKKQTELTERDKENLLSKSPYALPDNPSSKNFSASQIRRKMYEAYLVLFGFIERAISENNVNIDEFVGILDDLKARIEGSEEADIALDNKIDGVQESLEGEISGLSSDIADVQENLGQKADLVDGMVPASQLPTYVDDVISYKKEITGNNAETEAQMADLEIGGIYWQNSPKSKSSKYGKKILTNTDGTAEGIKIEDPEVGKIYIRLTDSLCFRWNPANSTMIEISKSVAVNNDRASGTQSMAYRADFGAENYADIVELQETKSDASNIENGEGVNSIQQKESSKGFGFDNPNYTPSFTPEFGAKGKDSTVLNGNAEAYGEMSTAEGRSSLAVGIRSHAEGTKTVTVGSNAHSEGMQSVARGDHSHAEGILTQANGVASHAEGNETLASQNQSHAEGQKTVASGYASHAEGERTSAKANGAHSEGADTVAEGYASHAEGISTKSGKVSRRGWVDEIQTATKTLTISTDGTIAVVKAEVTKPFAISYSVNNSTKQITVTVSPTPTANDLVAFRVVYSISGATPTPIPPQPEIGSYPRNTGTHAEGYSTEALMLGAHAEGHTSASVGFSAHAEGYGTLAFGSRSHAEGYMTEAYGNDTHVSGYRTVANYDNQCVVGSYNDNKANSVFEVGNGDLNGRKNAFEVLKDGTVVIPTGTKGVKIGNTTLTEAQLQALLRLI